MFKCVRLLWHIQPNTEIPPQTRLGKCKRRITRLWCCSVAWGPPLSFVEPDCLRRIIKSWYCYSCSMNMICDVNVHHPSSDHYNSLFMLIVDMWYFHSLNDMYKLGESVIKIKDNFFLIYCFVKKKTHYLF